MSKTDLKIQLNSIAALERLIGGDSEIEFELRKSIITEFAKTHLAPLADTMTRQLNGIAFDAINEAIDKNLFEFVKDTWNKRCNLKPASRARLEEEARIIFNDHAAKTLRSLTEDFDMRAAELLEKHLAGLDVKIARMVNHEIEKTFGGKFEEEIRKALGRIIGEIAIGSK